MSQNQTLLFDAEHEYPDVPKQFECRRPTRNDISRATKGGDQIVANQNLVLACAVSPTREQLGPIFEEYPALASMLAQELLKSVGGGVVFTVRSSKTQSD